MVRKSKAAGMGVRAFGTVSAVDGVAVDAAVWGYHQTSAAFRAFVVVVRILRQ